MKYALAGVMIFALSFSGACAADAPAPAPAPLTAPVELTTGDIQLLAAALHLAAQSCDTNAQGCLIGQYKDAELAKLQAANAVLQAKAKK